MKSRAPIASDTGNGSGDSSGRGADSPLLVTEKLPVSRETMDRLEVMRLLLVKWQAKTNLVAKGTIGEFWHRHVLDSLQILPLADNARFRIDLGSGGGFPGLVLAIAGREQSGRRHVLIESNSKKCAFLREVARETETPAEIINDRIENAVARFTSHDEQPNIVTARALAPLGKLLEWSAPLLAGGGRALFHKGREYESELADCRGLWQFDLIKHSSLVETDSVLLEISHPTRR